MASLDPSSKNRQTEPAGPPAPMAMPSAAEFTEHNRRLVANSARDLLMGLYEPGRLSIATLQSALSDSVRSLIACGAVWREISSTLGAALTNVWRSGNRPKGLSYQDLPQILDDSISLAASPSLSTYLSFENSSVVVRTEQCYRVPFGTLPDDTTQSSRLSNHVAEGLLGGAVVHVRGFVDRKFLEWVRSSGPDNRSPISYVTVVYDLRLSDGSYYPIVINGAIAKSTYQLLKPDIRSTDDADLVLTAHRALQSAKSIHDVAWLWDPTRCISQEGRANFAVDLRALKTYESVANWEQFCAKEIAKTIMAPHASRAQHAHNLPDILSTSWEEFKSRLRLEARNIASDPLNPRPDDIYLKGDEIEPFIEDQGKTLFNLSSALLEHLTTTRTPSPEMARRESLGYAGPREGFLLRPEYKLIDMIVDFRRKAKYIEIQALHNNTRNEGAIEVPARIGRSYNLTFPQISDLRRILKEAPPERYVHFRVLSRLTGLDITGEGRESLIEAQRTVELDSFSFIDQMHLERRSSLPQFGAYMKHLMMVHQDMTGFVRHYSDSLFLELPERPSLRGLFVGYDEQLRAWAGKALGDIGNQLRNRRLSSEERGTLEADLAKVKKSHQKIAARIGGWRTMTYELKLGALLPSEFFENQKGTVDITDHAIAKFIYVIRANGEIPVARESIGNDGTKARPTHSQLARGEPVYGAGELIIGAHHERTSSLHVWHDLDHKLSTQPKDHTWKLFEANNASGHYLPPAAAFLGYAFNEMKHALDSQGIITQEVRLENRLMPGTEFSGPSFL